MHTLFKSYWTFKIQIFNKVNMETKIKSAKGGVDTSGIK